MLLIAGETPEGQIGIRTNSGQYSIYSIVAFRKSVR
jgi:hypothetical protein